MAILVSGAAARLVPRPSGRPGLLGRVGGSVLALGWGLVSLVIVLSVARVLPLPPSFDRSLEGSRLAGAVAGEESVPRRAFQALAGEGALDELLVLEELFDSTRVVLDADDRVEFAPPPPDLVESSPEDARLVFRLVNEARAAAGRPPLAWFPELARVAAAHAAEMYRVGYVSHVSPTTGTVEDRVEAAGVTVRVVGENLALASSARAVHEGLMDSTGHRRNILSPRYDRLGVGAVSGPYGVMVVEVFGG